jgi:hypothetical protein
MQGTWYTVYDVFKYEDQFEKDPGLTMLKRSWCIDNLGPENQDWVQDDVGFHFRYEEHKSWFIIRWFRRDS